MIKINDDKDWFVYDDVSRLSFLTFDIHITLFECVIDTEYVHNNWWSKFSSFGIK